MSNNNDDYINLRTVNQYLDNLDQIKKNIDKISTGVSLCRYDDNAIRRVAEAITDEDVALSKFFKTKTKIMSEDIKNKWWGR